MHAEEALSAPPSGPTLCEPIHDPTGAATLPACPQPSPARLAEVACAELRDRWRVGDRIPAEVVLAHLPALADCPGETLSIVLTEIALREQAGETPDQDDLIRRFPTLAILLTAHFAARRTLAGPSTATVTDIARLPTPAEGVVTPPGEGMPFGPFRLLRPMPGSGISYLARGEDGRAVVVKVPALPNAGQAAVFRRESRAASVLENPHLASFVGSGEVEGKAYLATAFVQGRPLSVLAEGGRRLDPRGAVDICRKLALALEDAHQCGLFHRRLAIEHVLIDRRQQPVLIGFGLGNSSATALPPEATGDPLRVGPAGDVWLLGALLYHLLTGTRPVGPDPEPPSAVRPDLDPALDAVCRKALATDPARRYARMSEFAEVLGRWLAGGLSRPANRPGSRRWRWAASTLAGCLALGLSGFAALSLHGPRVPIGTLTEDRRLADAAELTGRGWEANEKDHDFSRAEGLFDKALALDADSPRAYFGRGYARVFLGRPDLALADFDRACELDPDNPRHHNARGWALNERGRHDAAAVAATRALELSPRFVEAFITRATAYNHVGRTAEALRDAERALELAPGQPWALHNRGVARRALGQADLAAADFAEARKRDPSAGAP